MNLKQITQLFFSVIFVMVVGSSCLNDSTTYTSETPSKDAQIYSMTLSASLTGLKGVDSANFVKLGKAKFSIDQNRVLIYNPDSLPYKTRLTKYLPVFTYGNPSKIEVVYSGMSGDSLVAWTTTDSIDFSLYPKLKVTPASGNIDDAKTYTIDILIHKVDPDSLVWTSMTSSLELPAAISKQKTLLVGNNFYTFSINNDSKFYLYTISKSATSPSWIKHATTVISPSVKLESITYFNNKFYAADGSLNSYSSLDGISWTLERSDIYTLLGVLPGETASQDSLLVIAKQSGVNVFAKTLDLKSLRIINSISYNVESNQVPVTFPAEGFSSITNYSRSNLNKNILAITGGSTFSNGLTNLTWSIRQGEGRLEVAPNQTNTLFSAAKDIPTFLYDSYLYALSGKLLYKTESFGYKWIKSSSKEVLYSEMPSASGQSIIVDENNYIWIFGGINNSGSPVRQVWKGRINRLAN